MTKTVIEHILSRLHDLGISDVFGVAGDYSFPINDAVCASSNMRWIGNCNELNAAYAADGYARIKGVAALSTTFAVGELSALNGIAGAFAERLPIFHLVGMPTSAVQNSHRLVHHTLGNGNFDTFYHMSQHVVCAHTIITPENCLEETERLIAWALRERRPVYFGIPSDYAKMPITEHFVKPFNLPRSHQITLSKVINLISQKMIHSQNSCALIGSLILRFNLVNQVQTLIEKTNIPYATMFMDKSVLSETNSQYIGIYNGRLMNPQVTELVENCDCVLNIGALMTDVNSGGFTANINPDHLIQIMDDHVIIGSTVYSEIYLHEILPALKDNLPVISNQKLSANGLGQPIQPKLGEITESYLYPRLEKIFEQDDIIFAETGTFSMGLGFALLPKDVSFHTQSLWGSIGWATPAAFGAAIAAPNRRTILATGEGSHQLTVQEISQFARFGLKPIIFVLNNDGYLIERLLCDEPESYYNDIVQWNYSQIPAALGCEGWVCKKVTTCDELDKVLNMIDSADTAFYIEIVTDRYNSSELLRKMSEFASSLYSS